MKAEVKGIKGRLADRSGLTLLEVMIAMGIFLIGSVGIIALFVTASVLHADASNRRKASFIANELLAEVRSMHFREVFAKTKVVNDTGTDIEAYAVQADLDYQGAAFDRYPLSELFFPLQTRQDASRTVGPILIEDEWIWCSVSPLTNSFIGCTALDGAPRAGGPHAADERILQPRTWFYVLNFSLDAVVGAVFVAGDPDGVPGHSDPTLSGAPQRGYIVIDQEWMPYDSRGPSGFGVADLDNDGNPDRGWGLTRPVVHRAGTPVTVAREHDYYAGFYYTVQFYPLNATGLEAHVIVTIGYGTEKRFRVHTFRSIYTPLQS